jgi:hypothetical protein
MREGIKENEGGDKEKWRIKDKGKGRIQVFYIWYIVKTFVNATKYPKHSNNKRKRIFVALLRMILLCIIYW